MFENLAQMEMKKAKAMHQKAIVVPPFTSSLDARVPAENVVLSHFVVGTKRWFVASEASNGKVFTATGNTEPLARRAAGLKTFQYLEARAKGGVSELSRKEIETARKELSAELNALAKAIADSNLSFPASDPREVILIELRAARDLVSQQASRTALARWLYPPLLFLGGAFAEGVIGVYAQRCVELLEKLLAA
jgi:hypothetical protein